jgi:hypothetical protein
MLIRRLGRFTRALSRFLRRRTGFLSITLDGFKTGRGLLGSKFLQLCKNGSLNSCVRSPWVAVSEVGDYMKSGGASIYWNLIVSTIKPSPSALAVGRIARKLLSVLLNAADPERLFSEFGRLITPARSRMADRQIHPLIVISADYKARQHDVETGGLSTEHTLSGAPKRFSDRAAAVLHLQQAARNGVNSIVSVSDVQLVSEDATVSSNAAGSAENVHGGSRLGTETRMSLRAKMMKETRGTPEILLV